MTIFNKEYNDLAEELELEIDLDEQFMQTDADYNIEQFRLITDTEARINAKLAWILHNIKQRQTKKLQL